MQDPKYDFQNGRVINRQSGEMIPEEEPVFVFRARDTKAKAKLMQYALEVDNQEHRAAVLKRCDDFAQFAEDYPNRMKEPDTDLSGPEY